MTRNGVLGALLAGTVHGPRARRARMGDRRADKPEPSPELGGQSASALVCGHVVTAPAVLRSGDHDPRPLVAVEIDADHR
ncbi:MAG TPA: hypothetical protein VFH23_08235 [Jiangellaceae bacterium]|nr:hypothetical protein [Jiangellaceae bacterium]